ADRSSAKAARRCDCLGLEVVLELAEQNSASSATMRQRWSSSLPRMESKTSGVQRLNSATSIRPIYFQFCPALAWIRLNDSCAVQQFYPNATLKIFEGLDLESRSVSWDYSTIENCLVLRP